MNPRDATASASHGWAPNRARCCSATMVMSCTQSPLGGRVLQVGGDEVDHVAYEFVSGGDVAIEARRAHADGGRQGTHRHGGEASGVGEVDRGGGDAVNRQGRRRAWP